VFTQIITGMDVHGVYFKKLSGNIVRVNLFDVPFDSKLNAVSYLPIKLAWAITIHSAQGMTIDALEVDLGTDIFAFGQVSQVSRPMVLGE
jgi:ATP-dependent exoDNAse (exonuclease V) alpha subunit